MDPNGLYLASTRSARGIAYNKNLIPADQAPKGWEDCVDPKYRGNIIYDTRAHRHGGGANIIFLNGKGYSLMWPTGREHEKMTVPWKKGTIIVPPAGWFHFHFPTSTSPTRYLALLGSFGAEGKYNTTLSVSKGGDCIDYKEEDPEIRRIYEEALAHEGIKSNMAPSLYT